MGPQAYQHSSRFGQMVETRRWRDSTYTRAYPIQLRLRTSCPVLSCETLLPEDQSCCASMSMQSGALIWSGQRASSTRLSPGTGHNRRGCRPFVSASRSGDRWRLVCGLAIWSSRWGPAVVVYIEKRVRVRLSPNKMSKWPGAGVQRETSVSFTSVLLAFAPTLVAFGYCFLSSHTIFTRLIWHWWNQLLRSHSTLSNTLHPAVLAPSK